jgi:anaerobic magnesium-protoporphyrin IX monomethyl ester cyclase
MARVLFTHSYFYRFDPKQWRMKQPYPPLATILAAAVIRERGFDVQLFDTNLRKRTDELQDALKTFAPHYLVVYDDGFNYLSKMCLTNMRDAARAMIAKAKAAGCCVIVSGSDASDHAEKYLAAGADYVIHGEGEVTLTELLLTLEANSPTEGIQGIAFMKDGELHRNPSRPVMRDLDALPLPAWDLVDMEAYRTIWRRHHGYFSLNIATTRGCPFKCNWCAKPIYGNRYTSRSPAHVVREIQWLLDNAQPDHFWMCDDIFGLKPGWVEEFARLVTASNLKFRYKIQSRADLLLEPRTIEALVRSGVETVWMGAESGSQRVLDAMDKGITIAQIHEATRLLRSYGVRVAFFLQFGYLGETQSDIEATIRMVLELMPDEVGISVSYPLPGTGFYENVKHHMREKRNWTDSDDLAMMFQGTFQGDYYRKLHQYVHSVYRTQRGLRALKKLITNPLRFTEKDFRSGLGAFYFAARSYALSKKLSNLKLPT